MADSKWLDTDFLREFVDTFNSPDTTVTISDELRKESETNRRQREIADRLKR